MSTAAQRKAAHEFSLYWGRQSLGGEKQHAQQFWTSLLRDVFGVYHPENVIHYEEKVMLDHTAYIDGYIPETHVLIEMKSRGKDLNAPIRQSDGLLLTPFQQAKRYSAELPYSQRPRWIVTCNFDEFFIYDMEQPTWTPERIGLKDLADKYDDMLFLVDSGDDSRKKETEVSVAAGELVGKLYEALQKQYTTPDDHSLNALCVRIVFCLYAEDAGIFGRKAMFHDYLMGFNEHTARMGLKALFRLLDTRPEERDPYLEDVLASFPYVNGGLFADENVQIPQITKEILFIIINQMSAGFDWSQISPTIFGAVFESTLNPEKRRAGGMHYTSIENIHKVIDPLFLDDLNTELDEILKIKVHKSRVKALEDYQTKIASLKFLDPACGSGNFLTETYISLRRLENIVIAAITAATRGITPGQIKLGDLGADDPIKVSIGQFYGIEINDFAVTVARTALWIAESQMMRETEDIINMDLDILPLKGYSNIICENALRLNWSDLIQPRDLDYVMGNPPFVGARLMNAVQKKELNDIFKGWKGAGNLDYVSCWYKKCFELIKGTNIKAAFVSTNSIAQGEQVAILWKNLFEAGVHFDFAYRTFVWDSEANAKAHVHCVIIGFSTGNRTGAKYIYAESGRPKKVDSINAYLIDADDVFIENRSTTICKGVPQARSGNKPIDDGNYLFEPDEYKAFITKEPKSKKWFRPWIGSREFINRKERYCLWLGDCPPEELRKMPECKKRVENVRLFRLNSKSAGTVKLAQTPTRFHVETILDKPFLVMPLTSSERRRYVPIGFLTPNFLASNLVVVVSDATIYDFGVLTSNVFMSWMRAVCGRLKSDYRITKDNVYNNFPWPTPTPAQKAKIEQTAQEILDARAHYPYTSLADLYDPLTMPSDLLKAHQQNDKAVMQAYGMPIRGTTEEDCVAILMQMYKEKVAELNSK